MLIDALRGEGVDGLTLLDIGGGVGAVQHELLRGGITRAVAVEAAPAYIDAASEEAARQGHRDRIRYLAGDFVALADGLEGADLVTLDRVICCYPDVRALVDRSLARAKRLYGLVYPRDVWWMRAINAMHNAVLKLTGHRFRVYIHPGLTVDALIRGRGFRPLYSRKTLLWQVAVYGRSLDPAASG